jgi:SAM-dependent methyltransferase
MNWIGKYKESWTNPWYKDRQHQNFALVDGYLKNPPKRLLDIGAGYAYVSQLFQEKYKTELYLLDGNFDGNLKRHNKYGDADSMSFYGQLKDLKFHYDLQKLNYVQVDANNIDISIDTKFDFICSWLSCGFHYPVNTYKELIKKHSNENTIIIMDIRRKTLLNQSKDFKIIDIIEENHKYSTVHFQFIN